MRTPMTPTRRALVHALVLSLSIHPLYPYADAMTDAGHDAQAFGQTLIDGINHAPPLMSADDYTLPSLDGGVFDNSSGTTININELYPGTSSTSGTPLAEYFPAAGTPDVPALEGTSDDGAAMDAVGRASQSALWGDVSSATPTLAGRAYGTVYEAYKLSATIPAEAHTLGLTNEILANIDTIASEFGDCSTDTTFHEITHQARVPELHTCDKLKKFEGDCTILHDLEVDGQTADLAVSSSGGKNLVVQFDLVAGTVTTTAGTDVLTFSGGVTPVDFAAVCNAGLGYGTKTVSAVVSGDPGATVSYTVVQEPRCSNNLVGVVQINDVTPEPAQPPPDPDAPPPEPQEPPPLALSGGFRFEVTRLLRDEWEPADCIADAKELAGEFCDGEIDILAGAPTASDCTTINGWTICPGDELTASIDASPVKEIPKLAQEIHIDAMDCEFNVGDMDCYVDASGVEQCFHNDGGTEDSCVALANDSTCRIVASTCVDGAISSTGTCHVTEEVYDCGTDVDVPDVSSDLTIDCAGPVRCMGADCITPEKTSSTSFAQVSALLNAADFMPDDMHCASDPVTAVDVENSCTVFGSNPYECKVAVGGIQNCCDVPTRTSMGTYIAGLMKLHSLEHATMELPRESAIRGAYQTLRDPVVRTLSEVAKPFTSYIENISGTTTAFIEPVTTFVQGLETQLREAVAQVIDDMLGNTASAMGADAGTALAGDAASQGAQDLTGDAVMQGTMNVAGYVMWAYTAYTVAIMAVQMLFPCETEEFELAVKKDTGSCHYVGSYCADKVLGTCIEKRKAYCCYNSPLARIVSEQVRGLLGFGYGKSRAPACGGLAVHDIASIDWSRVDLKEWTAMLTRYELLPTPAATTVESLTGVGSTLDVFDEPRAHAGERASERLDGLDVDAIREEAVGNTEVDPSGGG